MNLWQRMIVWLARVSAVDVGRDDDGLVKAGSGTRLGFAGTDLDKPWGDLAQEFVDALDAWRTNPLARRLIGLQVGYVVSDGLRPHSDYAPLAKFIRKFTSHPKNNLLLRQPQLYEELARSGELFLTLHMNPADGMSYLRVIPASRIDSLTWQPGDYETELSYHEVVGFDDPNYQEGGRTWYSPEHAEADQPDGKRIRPVMRHYAINRPVGCLRGESDLATILPWLRRYNRWLEDRVRLNAAMRAFLWIVSVPGRLVAAKQEQYRRPPEAGTVIIAEKDAEDWRTVTPTLGATDAKADGRAIKYMILAGSTGFALTDLGEGEDANLATAQAMGEQKTRWLGQRQVLFGYMLSDIILTAYNRAVRLHKWTGKEQGAEAITVGYPDINPGDNATLAGSAGALAGAFKALGEVAGLGGETWQRTVTRLCFQFAGQELTDDGLDKLITESQAAQAETTPPPGSLWKTTPWPSTDATGGAELRRRTPQERQYQATRAARDTAAEQRIAAAGDNLDSMSMRGVSL